MLLIFICRLLNEPAEYLELVREAVEETLKEKDPKYLLDGREMRISFHGTYVVWHYFYIFTICASPLISCLVDTGLAFMQSRLENFCHHCLAN